jgi:hypothetical protein
MFVAPLGQVLTVDAGSFVIVKVIAHRVLIEPGTGFFHRIAGFDAEKVQRFA